MDEMLIFVFVWRNRKNTDPRADDLPAPDMQYANQLVSKEDIAEFEEWLDARNAAVPLPEPDCGEGKKD
jgi:hypothetical protein